MQDMRDLHRQGLIADDYMDGLEQSMKHAKTLDHFEAHLERVSGKPDNDFRGSGGNKKGITANQRKRKRKAQRKARRVSV